MKIGLPTTLFQENSFEEALKNVLKLKPDCVEIVFDLPHFLPEKEYEEVNIKKIKNIISQDNVECSVHSSFYEFNLGSVYPVRRKAALIQTKKCLKFASLIEAKVVTVHPGYCPFPHVKKLFEDAKKRFIEDLKECLKFALDEGILLALENIQSKYFFFYKLDDGLSFIREMDGLGLTLDIGHAYISACELGLKKPENHIARIVERKLRNHIFHVHLHDNFGVKDNHLAPGDGKINFKPIVEALKKIGYDKQIIVEVWNPQKPVSFGLKGLKMTKKLFNFPC
jgi:sugar phosphate isomerase/epimerase